MAWTRVIIGKEKRELIQELLKRLRQQDLTTDQIWGAKEQELANLITLNT